MHLILCSSNKDGFFGKDKVVTYKCTNLDDMKAPASCERTYKIYKDSNGNDVYNYDSKGNPTTPKTIKTKCNPGPFDANMNLIANGLNEKCA